MRFNHRDTDAITRMIYVAKELNIYPERRPLPLNGVGQLEVDESVDIIQMIKLAANGWSLFYDKD